MITVNQGSDNSFTISWDENDPKECVLNDWTEKDFVNCIMESITFSPSDNS